MIVTLDEEHKEHLSFLNTVSVDVVKEFCRIAIEFMKKGSNQKVYSSAAQKLGVTDDVIQHAVEGLIHLFTECAAHRVTDADFKSTVTVLAMSEEMMQELKTQYDENQAEILSILTQMAIDIPHYHDLNWRLDVKIASRALRGQTDPIITLKLKTKQGDEVQSTRLQTDPVNLLHLTQTLEAALQDLKSPHCRRIQRNL